MSKRNVIIGAGGRLGSALCAACDPSHLVALRREDLDLEDSAAIKTVLDGLDYDTLWLTAAITDVDYCESHAEQTGRVNTDAAKLIAQISAEKGAQVILFSTDYVFGGEKSSPYREEDETRPLNIYGQSKLLAEQQILEADDQYLVVRLSWLFGHDKPGFPSWAINQAMTTDSLSVVSNRHSSPTYTGDVIAALRPVIQGEMKLSGILHLCNQGVCTWQEWAQYCVDCAAENGIPLLTRKVNGCCIKDIKSFSAQRPLYSAMSTSRYDSLCNNPMPEWKESVSLYIREHLAPRLIGANKL
ncbi:MAG: dTDP-4-dehydrorhamnose reductase [Verrucomicrobia bacterium]|nr:dTDP-4-dehydrorhamnose reductase [Verrucomicrobiota bacterium]